VATLNFLLENEEDAAELEEIVARPSSPSHALRFNVALAKVGVFCLSGVEIFLAAMLFLPLTLITLDRNGDDCPFPRPTSDDLPKDPASPRL
jgi:hypothetical protein